MGEMVVGASADEALPCGWPLASPLLPPGCADWTAAVAAASGAGGDVCGWAEAVAAAAAVVSSEGCWWPVSSMGDEGFMLPDVPAFPFSPAQYLAATHLQVGASVPPPPPMSPPSVPLSVAEVGPPLAPPSLSAVPLSLSEALSQEAREGQGPSPTTPARSRKTLSLADSLTPSACTEVLPAAPMVNGTEVFAV
jgi:hypothetical protein